jgi:magnesium chelatase subunit I
VQSYLVHNINLLGLRGQAKTRLARKMIELLDEYIPFVTGSEINDDPFNAISGLQRSKK